MGNQDGSQRKRREWRDQETPFCNTLNLRGITFLRVPFMQLHAAILDHFMAMLIPGGPCSSGRPLVAGWGSGSNVTGDVFTAECLSSRKRSPTVTAHHRCLQTSWSLRLNTASSVVKESGFQRLVNIHRLPFLDTEEATKPASIGIIQTPAPNNMEKQS